MKAIMIFLSALMTVLTSTAAFAHTDHHLGEGTLHSIYHTVFWLVVFAVIYKAIVWIKAKDNNKSNK
jgi:hypothetical protein